MAIMAVQVRPILILTWLLICAINQLVVNKYLPSPIISATSCPAARTVDCAYNVIPEPHLVQAESPCGVSNVVDVSGPEVFGTPNCPFTQYVFTYNVIDNCGQTTSCQQFFFLENEAPELIVPNEICIIECPEDPAMIINSFDAFAQNATVNTSCNALGTVITNNFNPNGFAQVNCNSNGFAIPNVKQ